MIWYKYQNKIEKYYDHDLEQQLSFYKKSPWSRIAIAFFQKKSYQNGIPEFLGSARKCRTLDSVHWTVDAGLGGCTLDAALWALDLGTGLWTMDAALWTLSSGHWTMLLTASE